MSIQKVRTEDGFVYKVRVRVVDKTTGKVRHPSRSFKFKRDAEKAERAWQEEVDRGTAVDPSKITVGVYLRQWLAFKETRVKPNTAANYHHSMDLYTIPKLGAILLQKLTAAQVQDFEEGLLTTGSKRTGKGLSKTYVHDIHVGLKNALKHAVRLGMVSHNVMDAVTPPPIENPPKVVWDQAQAQAFLGIAEEDGYWPLWLLALVLLLRRGELLALRWRHVDLKAGSILVRSNIIAPNGKMDEGTPKGGKSRTIQVDRRICAILEKERVKQIERHLGIGAPWTEDTTILTSAVGSIVHPVNVSVRFRKLCDAHPELPRIRLHDLRHSGASLLLGAGVPLHVVSTMLGHADPSITMRVYAHLLKGQDESAARVIASILLEPTTTVLSNSNQDS